MNVALFTCAVFTFCLGFGAGCVWQSFWSERNRREAELLDDLWNGDDDLEWD